MLEVGEAENGLDEEVEFAEVADGVAVLGAREGEGQGTEIGTEAGEGTEVE